MMSWSSVAIILPPQPSARAARVPWSIRFLIVLVDAHMGAVH